jgi:hypothetical protein
MDEVSGSVSTNGPFEAYAYFAGAIDPRWLNFNGSAVLMF